MPLGTQSRHKHHVTFIRKNTGSLIYLGKWTLHWQVKSARVESSCFACQSGAAVWMNDMDELMIQIQIAENVPVLKVRDTVTFPDKKVVSPQIMVIPFGTLMIPSNINNIFYYGFRLHMQLIVQSISIHFPIFCPRMSGMWSSQHSQTVSHLSFDTPQNTNVCFAFIVHSYVHSFVLRYTV